METGVYVSRTDTDEWEPDEEVGGSAHMLFDEGDESKVGLWRAEPGPVSPTEVELPTRETIIVLEGTVRIGIDGASTLELGPGDMASIPTGARITCAPAPSCKVKAPSGSFSSVPTEAAATPRYI